MTEYPTSSQGPANDPARPAFLADIFEHAPTGLLVLNARGEVLLYNRQESRMAGRTPERVRGRNFFREVAPCTNVKELADAFFEAMADPDRPLDVDLEFVFPFDRGHLDVRIRMRKVMSHGEPFGLLVVDDNTRLKATERELTRTLAMVQEQSLRDPLTELRNRRYLDQSLPTELARARRHGHALGAVMMDIDHFKSLNDTHGHPFGDRVLVSVGDVIRGVVRGGDVATRYGGEEFAILLSPTTADGAREVAERLRTGVASLRFPEIPDLRVTASLGVAVFDREWPPECTGTELLKAADEALYEAKRTGRDRVCAWTRRGM